MAKVPEHLRDSSQNTGGRMDESRTRPHEELQAKKLALAEENGGSDVSDLDILDINAGGQIVRVSRGTLTQIKGSRLEAIFSGRWEQQLQRDAKGRIFLDANPVCFKCIVDYLNEMKIAPPDNPPKPPKTDPEHQVVLDCLLVAFGMDTPVDSKILTEPAHLEALLRFLKEDDLDQGLTLLYRSSRDGLTPAAFHEKCDNQGLTVTIVKSTEGYIFGGFTNHPWTSTNGGRWLQSMIGFLFGLRCASGGSPVKLRSIPFEPFFTKTRSRHHSPEVLQKQIYHDGDFGPTFGAGFDLSIMGHDGIHSHNTGITYAIPGRRGHDYQFTACEEFDIAELEVFQVTSTSRTGPPVPKTWRSLSLAGLPAEIQQSLQDEEKALLEAFSELSELRNLFDQESVAVKVFCHSDTDAIVHLNVSGEEVAVKQSTLAQYPESVLYKQSVEPNWQQQQRKRKRDDSSPADWNSEAVLAWSQTIHGLSEDVSEALKDLNGAELLALEREDMKELGIMKPGTIALLLKAIHKLREDDAQSKATFIEHSNYCFGKIIDHLRLKAMQELGVSDPKAPLVRLDDRERYKRIVEYYFPDEATAAHFLKNG